MGNSSAHSNQRRPGNSQVAVSQAAGTPISRAPAPTPSISATEFST